MKAIALLSGGLDSTVAARVIQEQGLEVVGVNFKTAFGTRPQQKNGAARDRAQEAAQNLKIELKSIDISQEFLKLLTGPRHGFGSNMNPCIDCKIMMLRQCRQLMAELGASFVVTGEVLGQRPMSQHRRALNAIAKESGLEGLLLRPLSARLLEETIPEQKGWVDRSRLLSFSGRTRTPQMQLAEQFGLTDYPGPGGGCLLTDPEFTKRLRDLLSHQALDLNHIELLKIGRHFRFSATAKLVVGRNEQENGRLLSLAQENDYLFAPVDIAGPTALGRGEFNPDLIARAAAIICRYSDLGSRPSAEISLRIFPAEEERVLTASPADESVFLPLKL